MLRFVLHLLFCVNTSSFCNSTLPNDASGLPMLFGSFFSASSPYNWHHSFCSYICLFIKFFFLLFFLVLYFVEKNKIRMPVLVCLLHLPQVKVLFQTSVIKNARSLVLWQSSFCNYARSKFWPKCKKRTSFTQYSWQDLYIWDLPNVYYSY